MKPILVTLLISATLLSGCSAARDGRLNPFNWFGRSEPVDVQTPENVNPLIPTQAGLFSQSRQRARDQRATLELGSPIDSVTDLRVERVPGGAIIRATGRDRTQGAFDVQLVPETEAEEPVKGVLSYRLERRLPANAQPIGGPATREVVVARKLTDQQLAGVRTIRVQAASNARQARR